MFGDNLTYDNYTAKNVWPLGADAAAPANAGNPGYVRSGYMYYPQSTTTTPTTVTGVAGTQDVPAWPDYSTGPAGVYKSSICVPLFKITKVDPKKSMVVDVLYKGLPNISHKIGLSAAFGDGHVNWQTAKRTEIFPPGVWAYIYAQYQAGNNSTGPEIRYALSLFQP